MQTPRLSRLGTGTGAIVTGRGIGTTRGRIAITAVPGTGVTAANGTFIAMATTTTSTATASTPTGTGTVIVTMDTATGAMIAAIVG